MSLSITASNTSNPAAFLPSLLSQDSSASGTVPSSSLSELLASLGQTSGTSSSDASSTAGTAASGSSSQFGWQTLQTLFDLQANGSTSQLDGTGAGTADATDPYSAQGAQSGEGQHAHRHRHHAGGTSASDMFASAESATSETTANADGSSTTTVTCADGSSMTLTTAALTGGSSSTASSKS